MHLKKIKDINKRKLYIKAELLQRLVKIICFSFNTNLLSFTLLNSFFITKNYSYFRTHIKNFCTISGRSRAIHKKFKVSRILLLELGSKGYFFGLKKAS
jgi:succinate dehydrogenase (ubiquinone) iron-sulfur subunit